MGLMALVAQASGVALERVGSLELVAFDDAETFLEASAKEGLVVLGVEGFRIVAGQAVPDMESIADFSTCSSVHENECFLEEARRFIRKVGQPDMFFEFVFERRKPSVPG